MLKGKTVNLRIAEKEDLSLVIGWINDPDYFGEYNPLAQLSRAELEKQYDKLTSDERWFFIEKKDGSRIGSISCGPEGQAMEIGYNLVPNERGKGFGAEAVQLMVDYLFLSKEIMRIQARIDPRNVASQKVLEKTGFKKEGIIRKSMFIRGEWKDLFLFSILREEWKEPKILIKTVPEK